MFSEIFLKILPTNLPILWSEEFQQLPKTFYSVCFIKQFHHFCV